MSCITRTNTLGHLHYAPGTRGNPQGEPVRIIDHDGRTAMFNVLRGEHRPAAYRNGSIVPQERGRALGAGTACQTTTEDGPVALMHGGVPLPF